MLIRNSDDCVKPGEYGPASEREARIFAQNAPLAEHCTDKVLRNRGIRKSFGMCDGPEARATWDRVFGKAQGKRR